jgi:biopolymer transport protein ExbD
MAAQDLSTFLELGNGAASLPLWAAGLSIALFFWMARRTLKTGQDLTAQWLLVPALPLIVGVLQTGAAMAALSIQEKAVEATDYAVAVAPEIVGAGAASMSYLLAALCAAVVGFRTAQPGRYDRGWRHAQWVFLGVVLLAVLWSTGGLLSSPNSLVAAAVATLCVALVVQGVIGWRRPISSPCIERDAGLRLVVILGTIGSVGFISDVNTIFGKAAYYTTMASAAPERVNAALAALQREGEHLSVYLQITQPGMILLALGAFILVGPAWVRAHVSNRHLAGVVIILATILTVEVIQGGAKQTVEDRFRGIAIALPRPYRNLPASSSDLDPTAAPILRVDGEGILWRDQVVAEESLGALLREAGPAAVTLSTDQALSAERLLRIVAVCRDSGVGQVDLLTLRYDSDGERNAFALTLAEEEEEPSLEDSVVPGAFVARVEVRDSGVRSCAGKVCTDHASLASLQRTLMVVGGNESVRVAVAAEVTVQRLVEVIDHLHRIDMPDAGTLVFYPNVNLDRTILE